jgi:hypothetical protein
MTAHKLLTPDIPQQPQHEAPPPTLWQRLHFALGPLAGCLVLDFVDLATFGPVGLVLGVPLGAGVGYWLGSLYGFQATGRVVLAILSGIYCATPFTELLPVATIIGAVARFDRPVAHSE